MLQAIHNATKSWFAYIIMLIMVFFLVGAFALWGVGDIFRGGVDTTVATVGDHPIDRIQYEKELRGQIRQLTQGQTELGADQIKAMGIDKLVLDRMIERTALDERVIALGLTASDSAVRNQIDNEQVFQGTNGSFDRGKFSRILSEAGVTEGEYVNGMRGDVSRQQYILAAVAGMGAPPRLARLLFDYVSEQRTAEYVVVPPEAVGNPPEPTEAQLAAYHKAHTPDFSTPEYRQIEFVQIGVKEVAGEIPVSEADIRASWEKRKDDLQKPEQRELEQIAFPSEAAAQAAYAKLKSGTPFLMVAQEGGKSEAEIKLGTFAKSGQLDERLTSAAFAVAEGSVTPPVQGPFGWVILHVTHVTPGETKTYDQVHDQLRDDLIKERAAERIADVANKFEDARGSDKPLAEAATESGLTAQRAVVDQKGMTPEGTKAAIPAAPVFLQQVFTTDAGNESVLFENEDRDISYAIKVVGVRPPALKPLASVRAEVRARWIAEQRGKMLAARVEALTVQAQRERSVGGAARAIGATAATSPALTRNATGDVFSAAALAKLFGSPPGTAISAPLGKGQGYVVARVTRVTHPQPDVQTIAGLRAEVSNQLARDVGQTVALAARSAADVEINQQVLQQSSLSPGE